MSRLEDDLEVVRSGLEAFSRGAFDEALAHTHPEIEWHLTFRVPDLPPEQSVFFGRDEVRALWDRFAETWEALALSIEEVIAAEPGTVVARTRFRARGTVSGVEADRVVFYVFGIEDGLLRSIRPFETEAEAIGAAGLDPDA